MNERWSRLRALFAETQEIPEADRPAFLDQELGSEPELRAELDRLLASSASAREFLAADESALNAMSSETRRESD
jgi:hypothetical protein